MNYWCRTFSFDIAMVPPLTSFFGLVGKENAFSGTDEAVAPSGDPPFFWASSNKASRFKNSSGDVLKNEKK